MLVTINTIQEQASDAIKQAKDVAALEQIRVDFLGKKGKLTELLKGLANLSAEEKPKVGQLVNQAKQGISALIETKMIELKEKQLLAKLAAEQIDVTLSGRNHSTGSLHPVTQVKHRINDYFSRLGFDIVEGPEVETEFYNFEALNIPGHHPARVCTIRFILETGACLERTLLLYKSEQWNSVSRLSV